RSGAEIQRGIPEVGSEVEVALVLRDRLSGDSRERFLDWIQAGGSAVITDSTSPLLATGLSGSLSGEELERGTCDIEELDGVNELSGSALPLLVPVPNSSTCFGDDTGAYVIQFPDGQGQVTGLGGAVPFVNAQLDQADNAVLAGRLLLSSPNPTITVIYSPISQAAGQRSPLDLIGANLRWFGWQLVVATLVGLLWAIRRFGRVVPEPQVVELPGSLAIRATAELHRRSETPDRSVEAIRHDLIQRLRHEYRLPPDSTPGYTAKVVAEQSGVPLADTALLTGASDSSEIPPLDRAREIDRIGRRILGEPSPIARPTASEMINTTAPTDNSEIKEPSNV
ncbi:MAG: hypothetical protein KJN63_09250, partial [Acidimicrobiia bacterium]|nr:hypothetical protein [Acidimicrobiia bacterium]